jgi:DNA-binding XRE family transcriptional regulator
MAKSLKQVMNELPGERRKRVEKRAEALIQEQLTLQQLRRELDLTQERMADLLNVQQGHISKIEKRSDMLISTLRDYIEAMGGELELVARLPGRKPVKLDGFHDSSV